MGRESYIKILFLHIQPFPIANQSKNTIISLKMQKLSNLINHLKLMIPKRDWVKSHVKERILSLLPCIRKSFIQVYTRKFNKINLIINNNKL